MQLKVIAAVVVVLALVGAGYYTYTQYRDARVDVIGALEGERYFYDQVPLTSLTTLAPQDSERLTAELRAAVAAIAPDLQVGRQLLALEGSGEWNRIQQVASGKLARYGFTKVAGPGGADAALFRPDGVIRRFFDHRTIAVVSVPADPGSAFGYFELTDKT